MTMMKMHLRVAFKSQYNTATYSNILECNANVFTNCIYAEEHNVLHTSQFVKKNNEY